MYNPDNYLSPGLAAFFVCYKIAFYSLQRIVYGAIGWYSIESQIRAHGVGTYNYLTPSPSIVYSNIKSLILFALLTFLKPLNHNILN